MLLSNKWEDVNGKRIDAESIGKWFFQVDDPRQAMCIELVEKAIQERVNAQTSRFLAHTTAVTNFLNELYAIMVDPCAEGSISVAEMQKAMIDAARRDREYAHAWGFTEMLKAADAGLKTWAAKPENEKWWKRIDGTPIPNDLLVNIVEAIRDAKLLAQESKTGAVTETK